MWISRRCLGRGSRRTEDEEAVVGSDGDGDDGAAAVAMDELPESAPTSVKAGAALQEQKYRRQNKGEVCCENCRASAATAVNAESAS